MEKILILGSSGMLGHMLYYFLKSLQKYDIVDTCHSAKLQNSSIILDVFDTKKIEKIIIKESPNIIINCIGILIKGSENNPSNAIYVNSYFPHLLSDICSKNDCKLIHISTDCVFSGNKGNYSVNDFRDADNIYGRSKALGELNNDTDLTIRTSIIGPELKQNGEGLFDWFMKQNGKINGYLDHYWNGVTTLELAKIIDKSIENNLKGIKNVSTNSKISKYTLLNLIKDIWNKQNVEIIKFHTSNVDKSIICDNSFTVPSHEIMLRDLHNWMVNNKSIYTANFINYEY